MTDNSFIQMTMPISFNNHDLYTILIMGNNGMCCKVDKHIWQDFLLSINANSFKKSFQAAVGGLIFKYKYADSITVLKQDNLSNSLEPIILLVGDEMYAFINLLINES